MNGLMADVLEGRVRARVLETKLSQAPGRAADELVDAVRS